MVLNEITTEIADLEKQRSATLAQLARARREDPNLHRLSHEIAMIDARMESLRLANTNQAAKEIQDAETRASLEADLQIALNDLENQTGLQNALRNRGQVIANDFQIHYNDFLANTDQIAAFQTSIISLEKRLGKAETRFQDDELNKLQDNLTFIIGTCATALSLVAQMQRELDLADSTPDTEFIERITTGLKPEIKEKAAPILLTYSNSVRRNRIIMRYVGKYGETMTALAKGVGKFRGLKAVSETSLSFDSRENIAARHLTDLAAHESTETVSIKKFKMATDGRSIVDSKLVDTGLTYKKTSLEDQIALTGALQERLAAIRKKYSV